MREWLPLAPVACALFANAIAMSVPMPIGPFLVLFFGVTNDKRELGYTAGFFISSFMLGRMISSYPLGLASDIYGRRVVIQLGLVSCFVFSLVFGMAPTFGIAILSRFLMGAFNGIIGVSKAVVPELVPPSHRARAMSAITGMWGLGTIFGPALGGLLWIPGSPGTPSFWSSVVSAGIAMLALAAVALYMPDTRGRRAADAASAQEATQIPGRQPPVQIPGRQPPVREGEGYGIELVRDEGGPEALVVGAVPVPKASAKQSDDSMEEQPRLCLGVPVASLPPTAIYCLLSILTIIIDEIVPLWCVAPLRCGGLGLEAQDIGSVMSFSGLVLVVFQFFVYPMISSRLATRHVFQSGMLAYALLSIGMPFLSLIPPHQLPSAATTLDAVPPSLPLGPSESHGGVLGNGTSKAIAMSALVALNSLGKCAGSMAYTSIFLIINNSSGDNYRGRVNGLGMSVGSGFKAVGPTLGAVLFAWSITRGEANGFNADTISGANAVDSIRISDETECGVSGLIGAHFTFNLVALASVMTAAAAMSGLSPRYDEPVGRDTAELRPVPVPSRRSDSESEDHTGH